MFYFLDIRFWFRLGLFFSFIGGCLAGGGCMVFYVVFRVDGGRIRLVMF